jgi:hypothetical protein
MPETARICSEGSILSVPVSTPYEREILCEHVQLSLRRHSQVRLELDERAWLVSRDTNGAGEQCGACEEPLLDLRCAVDSLVLCLRCATDGAGL